MIPAIGSKPPDNKTITPPAAAPHESKVLRITIIICVTLLLLSVLLIFLNALYLSLILTIFSIILFAGYIIYIYVKYSRFSIVNEKRGIDKNLRYQTREFVNVTKNHLNAIKNRDAISKQEQRDIENIRHLYRAKTDQVNAQLANVDQQEQRKKAQDLSQIQNQFISQGMRNALIASASIYGIGDAKKNMLRLHGITSAADLAYQRVEGIHGFGQSTASSLMTWKSTIENRLKQQAPKQLTNEQITKIAEGFQKVRDELAFQLQSIIRHCDLEVLQAKERARYAQEENKKTISSLATQIEQQQLIVAQLEEQAQPYSQINFGAYLKGLSISTTADTIFGSGSNTWLIALIGFFILFCSCGQFTGLSSGAFMHMLATDTPTPSATPTITSTSTTVPTATSTVTYTPTITMTPTLTFTPTETPTPTITATPTTTLPPIRGAECIPSNQRLDAIVVNVVDGDTADVIIDNETYTIEYYGIDAPDLDQNEYYASQAREFNRTLISSNNNRVILISEFSEPSFADISSWYVIIGKNFINYELVAKGYARSLFSDFTCMSTFGDAELTARENQFGFWAPTPEPIRFATLPPPENGGGGTSGSCHPSYPGVCIPPPPPDLDCGDIPYSDFMVIPPDPHRFDRDGDGIGCES